MRGLLPTLSLSLTALLAVPAVADVEVMDLEGNRLRGELKKLHDPADTLTLEVKGKPKVMVLGTIVELVNRGRGVAGPVTVEAELRTGELIRGKLEKPRELELVITSALGPITIDLDRQTPPRWLRFVGDGIKPPGDTENLPTDTDALFGRNGALIAQGDIDGFDGDKVILVSNDLGEISRPLAEIGAIYFASDDDIPPAAPGLRALVEGVDGSVLQGQLKGFAAGLLRVVSISGASYAVPLSGVSKVSLSGGQFDYLSDLTPAAIQEVPHIFDAKVDHTPPFTGVRNFFVDRAYPGNAPLRLGGTTHRKGLGLHSWVSVTWSLDGKYRRFTGQVGIDDSVDELPGDVAERGSVIFRVLVDGAEKARYPAKGFLSGGMAPVDIKVDLPGAKTLTLIVDYAGNPGPPEFADTHIRDRVALVSPRLIK